MNYMKDFDIYGTKMQFSIFKRNRFKSVFGGIFSIITLIIIVIFTFFFGKDFFYKTNPIILFKEEHPDRYLPAITLNSSNLLIPWRISDLNDVPVNFENIVYPIISHHRYKKIKQIFYNI